MTYRDDLDALGARHAALEAEVQRKTAELAQASKLLAEARARSKLPVLEGIRVASPCNADWSKMVGDDRVRHCGACRQDVYNLSAMTRAEAEALVVARAGELCVRYYQRKDGTILLGDDCAVGVRRRRRRRLVVASTAAVLAGAALFALVDEKQEPPIPSDHVMGGAMPSDPAWVGQMAMPEPPAQAEPIHGEALEVRMGR